MGTKPEDIPDELVAAVFNKPRFHNRRDIATVLEWLCEHPAEAARLLGTRTPTSWDV